jgi:signal transduction histidine kinase
METQPMTMTSAQSILPPLSERNEARERLLVAEAYAERLGLVMTAAGHDLRQPLQIIAMAIERAWHGGSNDRDDFWRTAACDQIARLERGLTELTLAAVRKQEIFSDQIHPFSLSALMDAVEADWALAALGKDIELRFVHSTRLALGNPSMLRTILTNIVGNAVKYTSRGGVVVGCRLAGANLAVDVVDSGRGMDDAGMTTMFDVFSRTATDQQGLGIGLWLTRRLCDLGGHTLQVWSEPGRGTRVRLSIPAHR